jgi:uncharacterized protein (DUF608 family)
VSELSNLSGLGIVLRQPLTTETTSPHPLRRNNKIPNTIINKNKKRNEHDNKHKNVTDLQGHACIPDIQQSQTHWQTRISALFQRRPHDVKTPLYLPEEYKPQDHKFVDYLLDQSGRVAGMDMTAIAT